MPRSIGSNSVAKNEYRENLIANELRRAHIHIALLFSDHNGGAYPNFGSSGESLEGRASMRAHIIRFFDRLTSAETFDIVRTRSRVESMSDVKLFKYGCKRTESTWPNGEKRPLTMIETCELQVAREEWQKRKNSPSAASVASSAEVKT